MLLLVWRAGHTDTHLIVFLGDCNIPANATLLYDLNFVDIYTGNRTEGSPKQ